MGARRGAEEGWQAPAAWPLPHHRASSSIPPISRLLAGTLPAIASVQTDAGRNPGDSGWLRGVRQADLRRGKVFFLSIVLGLPRRAFESLRNHVINVALEHDPEAPGRARLARPPCPAAQPERNLIPAACTNGRLQTRY